MPKPLAGDQEVIQLTDEYTWMGGNPAGIAQLLQQFEFDRSTIESAIANAMSRHSCVSTYHSALVCKDLLEAALKSLKG